MSARKLKQGEKAAFHAIFHLLFLGFLKLAAGLYSGLTVMIADSISSFADTLGVFASYIGLRLSRKAATKNFEYGFYKIETFAALLVSLGIIYLGYVIALKGIESFYAPQSGTNHPFAITATIISILFTLRLARKLEKAGKKVNSLSLKANARDKKMDIFAEIAVLISIIADYQGVPYVEGVITIGIALIIFKEGLMSSKESLFFLLDYWGDPVLIKKIQKIFKREKDFVKSVKKLRLRRAGTFIFGEAFIEIHPFAGLKDLREELEILEEDVKSLNPYIKDFAIYTHISKSAKMKVAVPIKSGKDLSAKVANNLKETNAYLFAELKNGKIDDFYIKKLTKSEKKPAKLADFLNSENIQILIDNKLNSLIYYNLRRTHHILVYPNFADISTAEKTLKLLMIDT